MCNCHSHVAITNRQAIMSNEYNVQKGLSTNWLIDRLIQHVQNGNIFSPNAMHIRLTAILWPCSYIVTGTIPISHKMLQFPIFCNFLFCTAIQLSFVVGFRKKWRNIFSFFSQSPSKSALSKNICFHKSNIHSFNMTQNQWRIQKSPKAGK